MTNWIKINRYKVLFKFWFSKYSESELSVDYNDQVFGLRPNDNLKHKSIQLHV